MLDCRCHLCLMYTHGRPALAHASAITSNLKDVYMWPAPQRLAAWHLTASGCCSSPCTSGTHRAHVWAVPLCRRTAEITSSVSTALWIVTLQLRAARINLMSDVAAVMPRRGLAAVDVAAMHVSATSYATCAAKQAEWAAASAEQS